jgi:YegS/Rv2252/BmrU family lipid kinase
VNSTLICNPNAGRGHGAAALEPALRVLEGAGWNLSVRYTTGPGEATKMVRDAVGAGQEVVLVAGGDGTLHEAVQALAHTETALGYIPQGTVNIWAREVGIPLDGEGAARVIVDGKIECVDLGRAQDRYFLLMAGIGFDGEVVYRARSLERHKRRLGVLTYALAGLSTAPFYRGADVELRYDGIIRRVKALMLVLGNTRRYAGFFALTPNAVANDGWLDLCIIKGRGQLALARQGLPVLLSRSVSHSDVELLRVRELTVRADEPLPLQLDGEIAGTTPVRFSVASKALRAIVPKSFNSNLIA